MTAGHRERVNAELTAERERIVRALFGSIAVLGVLAYVPSVWLGLQVGAYAIVAVDTLVYAAVLLTLVFAAGRTTLQSTLLIGLCYLLGVVLSVELGPVGAGPMWLTVVPAMSAVLLGRRATFLWLWITLGTGAAIAAAYLLGWVTWTSPSASLALWAVLFGNGAVLGGAVAMAVIALVGRLRSSADRTARITEELAEEHERTLAAHRRADEEAAERRRAEAQLRQSERLTAIGTLAAGIAHDFNNLLTPILAAPELLAEDRLPHPDRDRILGQVESAALTGRELVRRLLAFSRPSGGPREPIPAVAAVHDAIRLLRATLPASVSFDIQLDQTVGDILLTPAEVHQIVLNLGSNAQKAMEDGGTLAFRLSEVSGDEVGPWVSDERPDIAVRLTVADEGTGMDPETAARIFDPFFTTDREKGTGLGLATVHGIVTSAGV